MVGINVKEIMALVKSIDKSLGRIATALEEKNEREKNDKRRTEEEDL